MSVEAETKRLKSEAYPDHHKNLKNIDQYISKRVNYIFIFDYDDTLFPSWFFRNDKTQRKSREQQREEQTYLYETEKLVHNILATAHQRGLVYIITNAESSWVTKSIKKYFPRLEDIFRSTKIISARDMYSGNDIIVNNEQLKLWKFKAINKYIVYAAQKIHSIDGCDVHIVSIGDSNAEIDATIKAVEDIPWCICKTIKLAEQPTIQILKSQLQLLSNVLDSVMQHNKGLILEMKLQHS